MKPLIRAQSVLYVFVRIIGGWRAKIYNRAGHDGAPTQELETKKKGFLQRPLYQVVQSWAEQTAPCPCYRHPSGRADRGLAGIYNKHEVDIIKESEKSAIGSAIDTLTGKKKVAGKAVSELAEKLESLKRPVLYVTRLDANMERLVKMCALSVRKRARVQGGNSRIQRGFCLKHFKLLLISFWRIFQVRNRPSSCLIWFRPNWRL